MTFTNLFLHARLLLLSIDLNCIVLYCNISNEIELSGPTVTKLAAWVKVLINYAKKVGFQMATRKSSACHSYKNAFASTAKLILIRSLPHHNSK